MIAVPVLWRNNLTRSDGALARTYLSTSVATLLPRHWLALTLNRMVLKFSLFELLSSIASAVLGHFLLASVRVERRMKMIKSAMAALPALCILLVWASHQ